MRVHDAGCREASAREDVKAIGGDRCETKKDIGRRERERKGLNRVWRNVGKTNSRCEAQFLIKMRLRGRKCRSAPASAYRIFMWQGMHGLSLRGIRRPALTNRGIRSG